MINILYDLLHRKSFLYLDNILLYFLTYFQKQSQTKQKHGLKGPILPVVASSLNPYWSFQSPEVKFFLYPSFIEVYLTNKSCIYLRYTIWWFAICIHHEMITMIKLIHTFIISHSYLLFLMWWEQLRSTFLANFKYVLWYYEIYSPCTLDSHNLFYL